MTIGTYGESVILEPGEAQRILDDLEERKVLLAQVSSLRSAHRLSLGEASRLRLATEQQRQALESLGDAVELQRQLRRGAERKLGRAQRAKKLSIVLGVLAGVGVGLAFAPLVL